MAKFQNKYRIESNRLKNWDYSSPSAYFITINTKNSEHFFGEITDGQMMLSEIGLLANKYWNEIPEHFPFVILDEFVVMPNHVHGIIIIDKPDNDGRNVVVVATTTAMVVETQNFASLPPPPPQPPPPQPPPPQPPPKNKFGPQSKNLASIVRGFKIGVTVNARKINPNFAWQPNYHDHIIRNEQSYQNIKNYIQNNPKKWNQNHK